MSTFVKFSAEQGTAYVDPGAVEAVVSGEKDEKTFIILKNGATLRVNGSAADNLIDLMRAYDTGTSPPF